MDKLKDLFSRPLITGIVGLVIGVAIGWFAIGWGVWPIEWKDADASLLRQDLKAQYLCMIVDSYKVNQDANLAAARINSLGTNLETSPFLLDSIQGGGCSYKAGDEVIMQLKSALSAGTGTIPAVGSGETPISLVTPSATSKTGTKTSTLLLSILCARFLIIGGALLYIFFIRNRNKKG